jgi:DNA-binding transcriptional LysR family regulator
VADDLAAGRLVKPFSLVVEEERRAWYVIHRPGAEKEAPFGVFVDWLAAVVNSPAA